MSQAKNVQALIAAREAAIKEGNNSEIRLTLLAEADLHEEDGRQELANYLRKLAEKWLDSN